MPILLDFPTLIGSVGGWVLVDVTRGAYTYITIHQQLDVRVDYFIVQPTTHKRALNCFLSRKIKSHPFLKNILPSRIQGVEISLSQFDLKNI